MAFGLGFCWVLWDRGGQTWGDKLAGTRVVEGSRIPQPGDNPRFKYKEWSMSKRIWFLIGLGVLLSIILMVGGTEWWRILVGVSIIVGNTAFTMLMARFGSYIELRPREIRLQSRWSIKYADVDSTSVSMEGKTEVKFYGKNWFGRPGDQTTTFEIEGNETFVEELRARFRRRKGRALLVVH